MRYAQTVPTDGVVAASHVVLEARYVDAIDAVGCVVEALAEVTVGFPFAHTDMLLWCQGEPPSCALALTPLSGVEGACAVAL